jgi:hypothetical protein
MLGSGRVVALEHENNRFPTTEGVNVDCTDTINSKGAKAVLKHVNTFEELRTLTLGPRSFLLLSLCVTHCLCLSLIFVGVY